MPKTWFENVNVFFTEGGASWGNMLWIPSQQLGDYRYSKKYRESVQPKLKGI